MNIHESVKVARDLSAAIKLAEDDDDVESIYVIGGASVYNLAMKMKQCSTIFLTRVYGDFQCDVFISDFPSEFLLDKTSNSDIFTENNVSYEFQRYDKTNISALDTSQN